MYPVCTLPSLDEAAEGDFELPDNGPMVRVIPLYPPLSHFPGRLPTRVERELRAALRQRNIDANAFGAGLRRLLEEICADRNANGSDLYSQLRGLGAKTEIPARLVEVVQRLRSVGNVGAHAGEGVLEEDLPLLIDLCETVLDYIYRLPRTIEAIRTKADQNRKGSHRREA